MALVNEANYLVVYGTVTVEGLSRAVKVCVHPRDKVPDFGIGEKVAVVVSEERMRNDPNGSRALINEVQTNFTKAGVGEKTVVNVARRMATNLLKNLDRHVGVPYASNLHKPLRGVPAFIVAAGASLDSNIHLLPECAKHGVIFGMNTSAKAIRKAGVQLDVIASIESIDVTETLRIGSGGKPYPILALDATANPLSWDIPAEQRISFVNNDPAFSNVVTSLGGMPTLAHAEPPPLVEEILAPARELLPSAPVDLRALGLEDAAARGEDVPAAALAGIGVVLLGAGLLLARRAAKDKEKAS